MCDWEGSKKKRQRGRRTAGVFRRGSNHSPQLLSTLLPPPLQLCSALASRRVRSNLSLAFCCCCCCGYTGCLSLSLPFSFLFPLFLPFTLLLLLQLTSFTCFSRLRFFCSFCCLANYASRAFLCSILSCAGTHPHKVSHIVRAYQKLIYPHTLPGMWHVAATSAFVMKSKLTNFLERQQQQQQ